MISYYIPLFTSNIFILLSILIISTTPPASGYEISIYEAYPTYFWLLLIISFSLGIAILIHQALVSERSMLWAGGFYIVVIVNIIVIILPILRGYFISSGGDEISHLGMIKDIELTTRLGFSNVYPLSHILAHSITSICGLDLRLVLKFIPCVFYLIYLLGLYLLADTLCDDFGQVLLILAFGSVLSFTYFNNLFLPTQLILYLLPLLLFLFFKYIICYNIFRATTFIVFLMAMPFLHPLGSTFLVVIFIQLVLSMKLYKFMSKDLAIDTSAAWYSPRRAFLSGVLLSIIFLSWFINFAIFKSTFIRAYEWFFRESGPPEIITITETVSMSGLNIPELVRLFLMWYGPSLIFSFITLLAILAIIRKIFSRSVEVKLYELFFSILFIFFSFFFIATYFGDFIITGFSLRIFCWALVPSIIINGISTYNFIKYSKYTLGFLKKNLMTMGLFIMIVTTAILGVFSVYPSPHILQGNMQVTTMEWTSMIWFYEHKNDDNTLVFSQLSKRAPHYLYGYNSPKPKSVGSFIEIPVHLGYDKNESLADSITSDSYMIINDNVRVQKELLWPQKGKYTIDDLNQIDYDPNIVRLYSNSGLDVYRVTSMRLLRQER